MEHGKTGKTGLLSAGDASAQERELWWALRGAGSSLGVVVNATFLARELPARGIFVDKAPAGLRKPCSLFRSTVDMVSPRKKPHRLYFAALRKEKKAEMLLFVHANLMPYYS